MCTTKDYPRLGKLPSSSLLCSLLLPLYSMFCNGLITNNIDTESTATTSSAIELMFTEEIDYKSKHLQQSTIQQCMQAVEQEEAEVNHHSLRNDNLKPMQDEFFKQLRDLLKSGRLYDKVFAAVLVFELPLGVLSQPSLQHMCNTCHKHLHPPQPSAMSKKPPTPPNLPPNSLINGRFKGTVPTYLSKLTTIEMSMIALRSSIVKIIVAGGKYHAALGEMFTIINDVVQVNNFKINHQCIQAENLPRKIVFVMNIQSYLFNLNTIAASLVQPQFQIWFRLPLKALNQTSEDYIQEFSLSLELHMLQLLTNSKARRNKMQLFFILQNQVC